MQKFQAKGGITTPNLQLTTPNDDVVLELTSSGMEIATAEVKTNELHVFYGGRAKQLNPTVLGSASRSASFIVGSDGIRTQLPQSVQPNSFTRKDYVDGKLSSIPDAYTSLKADGYTGTKVQLKDSLNAVIGIQPSKFLDTTTGGEVLKPVLYKGTVFTDDAQLVNMGYVKQQTISPAKMTEELNKLKTTLDADFVKVAGSTMTGDLKMEGLASVRFVNGASTAFTVDQFVDGSGMTNFEISAGATGATSTVVTTTAPSYGGIAYNNGVSVSASTGIVTVSVDGGNTWQRSAFSDFVVSGFSPNMVSVANNRFFIGSSTSLYTSVDGSSWTKCAVASEQYFAVVYVGSQYIAGTANGVVRSTDALTWTKVTVSTSPYRHYYAVASSGNLAVISGLGAACFTSTDGTTWVQKPNIPSSADIMRLDYVNNTWFALARDRTVYRSTDNAGTWKKLTVPTTLTGQGHALVATPDYVIVGYGPDATFFTSTDNGDTWKSSKLDDTSYIISVAPIDATSVMFVTQQGNVHKTSLGKTGTVPFRANVDGVFTDVTQNTANNALVRKDYVDTLNSIGVKRTGDVMTGALTITTPHDSPLILNNTDDSPFYITFRRNDENRFFLRHQKAATMEEDSLEMVSAAKTGDNYIIPLKVTGSGVYSGVPTANSSIALTRKDYVDGRLGEKINRIGDTMTGQLTLRYNAPVMTFIETDNADKKWAFAAAGGTFRIHEDSTGITDAEVVMMVTLDKKTAIRNPTSRNAQGTTPDSLTRKDYVDGEIAKCLSKTGGTITGDVNIVGKLLINNTELVGATGAQGPAGPRGPAGPQGPKGATGAAGSNANLLNYVGEVNINKANEANPVVVRGNRVDLSCNAGNSGVFITASGAPSFINLTNSGANGAVILNASGTAGRIDLTSATGSIKFEGKTMEFTGAGFLSIRTNVACLKGIKISDGDITATGNIGYIQMLSKNACMINANTVLRLSARVNGTDTGKELVLDGGTIAMTADSKISAETANIVGIVGKKGVYITTENAITLTGSIIGNGNVVLDANSGRKHFILKTSDDDSMIHRWWADPAERWSHFSRNVQFQQSIHVGQSGLGPAAANLGGLGDGAITIGDVDSGLKWGGDGIISMYSDGVVVGDWSAKSGVKKFQINGEIAAVSVTQSSDVRLKHNVAPIEFALDTVNKLQGVTYNLNETGAAKCGFIAQEVETVIPDVVHTDANGMKSIEYASMVSYMAEAIKELTAQVKQLQEEVNQLKAK